MKFLHIALDDKRYGDSAGAVLLHEKLLQNGQSSELWVFERTSERLGVHTIRTANSRLRVVRRQELAQILQGRALDGFDVVHLHGMTTLISPEVLQTLAGRRLLWSLDGCGAYTGGCSHSVHCDHWRADYEGGCRECPVYDGKPNLQQAQAQVYALKKRFYAKGKLEFLCANEWLKGQLGQSIAKGQAARVLPELLVDDIFFAGDRKMARRALGIPERAFVLVLPSNLVEGRERVLDYVRSVLEQIRNQYRGYVVLVNLGRQPLQGDWYVDEIRELDPEHEAAMVGAYYRAADLQLYLSGTDSGYRVVREASLCSLPSAVFDYGPAVELVGQEKELLIPSFSESSLTKVLLDAMANPARLEKLGTKLYMELLSANRSVLSDYLQAYCGIQPGQLLMQDFSMLFQSGSENIAEYLQQQLDKRWPGDVKDSGDVKAEKLDQRHAYIDTFCRSWLHTVSPADPAKIWELVRVWLKIRAVSGMERFWHDDTVTAHRAFLLDLRRFLVDYLQKLTLKEFSRLPRTVWDPMTLLWYYTYLNTNSVVNRAAKEFVCPPELLHEEGHSGYPMFLLWSLFVPYVPKKLPIHPEQVLLSEVPVPLRVILIFWLVTGPYFGGTEEQRQSTLRCIEETCRFLIKRPAFLSGSMRKLLMDRIMVSLWSLSYLGGNNIQALRAYGDYLQSVVHQGYKEYEKDIRPRHRKRGEKLRVGYVSMNFRDQAVPQYMANRLRYADHERFFIKSFVLMNHGTKDSMTEHIHEWSDEWEDIEATGDKAYSQIAKAIKSSKLDLLIYADIGMNNMTYLLGAMKLAPVQAVLVGHGTSTGLSTIDYYVSGDHEPENAQEHYVEKVVRLPNAGAAQLPPAQNDHVLTRKQFQLPEDAVVFLSCANGLKHIAERDHLLIEILKRAPKAYILLKPFVAPEMIDWKLRNRIMTLAEKAGVADRIRVQGPLPQSGDLMAFIKLADVQLDTYPYGGWTTNLEALYYHLPIVTQQGSLARSRWGARMLECMGIGEGLAHNEQEYVDWAVKFAEDEALRRKVSDRIAEMAPKVLFDGQAVQPDYEKTLVRMVEEKEAGLLKR